MIGEAAKQLSPVQSLCKHLLGRSITLDTRLSDCRQTAHSDLVRAVQKLGSDGGFARYRLTFVRLADF